MLEYKTFKVGNYYTVKGREKEFGTVKLVSLDDEGYLVEYDNYCLHRGFMSTRGGINRLKRYHEFTNIKEGKDYEGWVISNIGRLKPAYKAVKDTALARKMYPKPFKKEEGYLYVKV